METKSASSLGGPGDKVTQGTWHGMQGCWTAAMAYKGREGRGAGRGSSGQWWSHWLSDAVQTAPRPPPSTSTLQPVQTRDSRVAADLSPRALSAAWALAQAPVRSVLSPEILADFPV